MKKFLFLAFILAMLVCFAVGTSAAEFDKTETVPVKLSDGTTQSCALYDDGGNALVWYTLDGGATLISVKASDLVYSSTTSLADISLADGTALQKVSETSTNTIVVANFRELTITESAQSGYKTTFMKSTLVQYIYMPSTLKIIRCNAVQECTNLVVYDIPSDANIETLEANTFNGCKSLKEINLGNSLKGIGGSAFYNCKALTKVYIEPTSPITKIDGSAFDQCPLTQFGTVPNEARVPDSVTTMGNNVFKKSQFKVLYLPKNLQTLGYNVADGNANLTDVYMPEVLTSWDVASFINCTALKNVHGFAELFENGYLTKIPGNTFYGCTSLEYIFENNEFPSGLETIGYNAFRDCKALKTPTFSNSLKVTESYAFYNCDSFGPTIVFPNSLQTFGQTSLGNCDNIEVVYMGAGVTAFGGYDAFNTMSKLTTIYMPSGITNVPINTFHNSGSLTTVYFTGTKAQLDVLYETATKTSGNTNFTRLTQISYSDYLALDDKSGRYAIYDYNTCDAFYNSTHVLDEEKSNACAGICANCALVTLRENPIHDTVTTLAYANGFNTSGTKTVCCQNKNCPLNIEAEVSEIEAIFVGFVYSTREENDSRYGMVLSYGVNQEALSAYQDNTGKTVSYGVMAIAEQGVNGNPLKADGTPNAESIIATNVTGAPSVDLIIWGSKAAWEAELEDGTLVADLDFYILGYAIEENVLDYFYGEASSTDITALTALSYNDIKVM